MSGRQNKTASSGTGSGGIELGSLIKKQNDNFLNMMQKLTVFRAVLTLKLSNKLKNHCWLTKRGKKGNVTLSYIMYQSLQVKIRKKRI